MTVKNFFEMMESANEFKVLIGEAIKTKASVVCDDNVVGVAYTYEQFLRVLDDEFNAESKEEIINAKVKKTTCIKEFKVFYMFDGEKRNIKLFVE